MDGPFNPPPRLDRARRSALARAAGMLAVATATGAETTPLARTVATTLAPCDAPTAEAVVRWAEAEGLAALISAALVARIPPTIDAGLQDTAGRVASRAAALAADRARIAAALAIAGVPWRPLKGAWLADHAYGDDALRPMADTDIWVSPDHVRAAHDALVSLGYRRVASSWKHASYAQPDAVVIDARGEHPDNPRPIDVHPRLVEGFRGIVLDVGALAGRSASDPVASIERWPDAAAMLLHVAAHATVDALGRRLRLLTLVDVAVLATGTSEATWQRVLDAASTAHAARFIWPALHMAWRDLDAPVPTDVLDDLAVLVRAPLRDWVVGVDIDQAGRHGGPDAARALLEIPRAWPLDAREMRTVVRWIAWPPRAALADRYPVLMASRRWPAAYGLHIVDLWRGARARWRARPRRRPAADVG